MKELIVNSKSPTQETLPGNQAHYRPKTTLMGAGNNKRKIRLVKWKQKHVRNFGPEFTPPVSRQIAKDSGALQQLNPHRRHQQLEFQEEPDCGLLEPTQKYGPH